MSKFEFDESAKQIDQMTPENLFPTGEQESRHYWPGDWSPELRQQLETAAQNRDYSKLSELAANARFDETGGRHAFYNTARENREAIEIAAKESGHFTLEQTAAGGDFDRVFNEHGLWEHDEGKAREVMRTLSVSFAEQTRGSAFIFEGNGGARSIAHAEMQRIDELRGRGQITNVISDVPTWEYGHGPWKNQDK